MTRRYLKLVIADSLLTPAACTQQSEIRQIHRSVSILSQEMTQLNQQTTEVTQQDALNVKPTRGVYLLPETKTPARLESQIDALHMSVGSITPDGDGSHLTLCIQGESNDPLPAFTATVTPEQITGTTHSYQEASVQDQLISVPASILVLSDADISLRLNVTPDEAGLIRVHDIQPAATQ